MHCTIDLAGKTLLVYLLRATPKFEIAADSESGEHGVIQYITFMIGPLTRRKLFTT